MTIGEDNHRLGLHASAVDVLTHTRNASAATTTRLEQLVDLSVLRCLKHLLTMHLRIPPQDAHLLWREQLTQVSDTRCDTINLSLINRA